MKENKLTALLKLAFGALLVATGIGAYLVIKGPDNIFPCRTWYYKPYDTGVLTEGIYEDDNYKLIQVSACIFSESTNKVSVGTEPESILIGFFDNKGKLHTYNAFLGSPTDNSIGFCKLEIENSRNVCKDATGKEIADMIENGRVYEVSLVVKDNEGYYWDRGQGTNTNYIDFLNSLGNALQSKKDFPERVDNIIVSQMQF